MAGDILGNNKLWSADIEGTPDSLSTHPAENMTDGRTNTQAGFATGADRHVIYDFGADVTIDSVGIAKHNLGSTGCTITLATGPSFEGPWTDFYSASPETNSVFFDWFGDDETLRYMRVSFSGHGGTVYVSDLTVGYSFSITVGQPVGWVTPFNAYPGEMTSNTTRGNELAGLTMMPTSRDFRIHIEKIWWEDAGAIHDAMQSVLENGPFYFKWANTFEDGIDGGPAFCWLRGKMPQIKWDSSVTRGMIADCRGIV